MRHPAYKIMEVEVINGKRTESIMSKQLMFKSDAERVAQFHNGKDATWSDVENMHYWMVVDKENRPVLMPRMSNYAEKK